jgi:hypothetical protein
MAFLYYGLPLRLRLPFIFIVNVVIVIVIVHPLFKWNIYLSLYVILYVFFLSLFSFSSSKYAVEECDM